ncbi:hypothetical protein EDB92DRAFT_1496639 [Lactarius akahatsu]|uniref:Uncharacterized protein n=1 Tax=Lactarius akahatsu TaxID=416441 RepID=A0AAD4Q4S1_9AGAM|nr:hypothetical protein EDB92DRAFT_1496639 [Lactarius akahatsu]
MYNVALDGGSGENAGMVRTNHPIPPACGIYYYEIEILRRKKRVLSYFFIFLTSTLLQSHKHCVSSSAGSAMLRIISPYQVYRWRHASQQASEVGEKLLGLPWR